MISRELLALSMCFYQLPIIIYHNLCIFDIEHNMDTDSVSTPIIIQKENGIIYCNPKCQCCVSVSVGHLCIFDTETRLI
jgi:hypothetical protein